MSCVSVSALMVQPGTVTSERPSTVPFFAIFAPSCDCIVMAYVVMAYVVMLDAAMWS